MRRVIEQTRSDNMLPKMQEAVNELKGFKESLDEIRVSL